MPPKDSRKQGGKPPNKGGGSKKREMALNSVAKKASGPGNIKQRATTSTTAEDITTPETKTNVESSEGTLPPGNVGSVDSRATPAESPKKTDTPSQSKENEMVQDIATGSSIDNTTSSELSRKGVYRYQLPFTIYERFIPDGWNKDSDISRPHDIFPVTGERRKKEVKDNFDWLQPVSRPADVAAVRQAYEDNYTFKEGFHTSDKSASQTKYSIPTNIMIRCANFTTYAIPMDHPLCNVEQSTNWLIKPAAHLLNRIRSATLRTHTRSSVKDASLGQDLFISSAYITADEFVTSSDDIELIDFVHGDSSKKVWHCSRTDQSEMLTKACVQAFVGVHEIDPDKFSQNPDWLDSITKKNQHMQFLGIVSLYQNNSGTKVIAFRLHSFVLYSFNTKSKSTVVHLALTETRLTGSTAQERLYQILQMLQSDLVGSTALTIAPHFRLSKEVEAAYTHLGFSKMDSPGDQQSVVLSRNAIIK